MTIARDGLPIVREASLRAAPGEITVLLGLNGAGKTTLLEGISGVIPIAAGSVSLNGVRIDRKRPYRRAALGLTHVEQGRSSFTELTTEENLLVASGGRSVAEAMELFPNLERRRAVRAGLLSGGEQQMLALARAFLRQPQVLLVDELSLGLAPLIVRQLMTSLVELQARGLAILLVEQFAPLALEVGQRVYLLRGGEVVFDGDCAELRADPALLQRLYLGEVADVAVPR
ncbi:MAG: ATP-binding cassette domain-containing protein [Actinomycetota bacterium]|nr:ATP-binding cassette domain-containing protein [Actinomycetota bacterium]MDQ2955757.1 ATP-binding cassette domain-containing protein [Actinomycetota bacterium]